MKHLITVLWMMTAGLTGYSQTILIANNNPGAAPGTSSNPNVYTGSSALQNAFSAATAGDIIYVIPSGNNYGSLTIDKSITIFGGGFDPDKEGAALSYISSVTIQASDIRISGITFTLSAYSGGKAINFNPQGATLSNIMFDKCVFQALGHSSSGDIGNLIVQNCIAGNYGGSNLSYTIHLRTSYSNVRISNNIIYGSTNSNYGCLNQINAADIEHNLFVGSTSNSDQEAFHSITNCNIRNNIFYAVQPTFVSSYSGNNFDNNISNFAADNNIETGNGNTLSNNQEGVDPQLVDMPFDIGYNFSNDPSLTPGSPAEGAADDGTDIGLFGGGSPFDITGTPLPLVQVVDIPPTVKQGNDMPVNVKARGN